MLCVWSECIFTLLLGKALWCQGKGEWEGGEGLAALVPLLNYWGARLLCSHWTWTRAEKWTLRLLSLLPFFIWFFFSCVTLNYILFLFCLFLPLSSHLLSARLLHRRPCRQTMCVCFQAFGGILVHPLEADWCRADKRSSAARWMFNGTNCEYLMRVREWESHLWKEKDVDMERESETAGLHAPMQK